MRLCIAVADAGSRVGSHAATSRWMIQISAVAHAQDLRAVRASKLREYAVNVFFRNSGPRLRGAVEAVDDLRLRVAPLVARRRIERQFAVKAGMNVVIRPYASAPPLIPRPPVVHEIVAEKHLSTVVLNTRRFSGVLPNSQVMTDVRLVLRAAEKPPRDQTVLRVHPRIHVGVEFENGRGERMSIHVFADLTCAIRDAVGEPG